VTVQEPIAVQQTDQQRTRAMVSAIQNITVVKYPRQDGAQETTNSSPWVGVLNLDTTILAQTSFKCNTCNIECADEISEDQDEAKPGKGPTQSENRSRGRSPSVDSAYSDSECEAELGSSGSEGTTHTEAVHYETPAEALLKKKIQLRHRMVRIRSEEEGSSICDTSDVLLWDDVGRSPMSLFAFLSTSRRDA